MGHLNQNERARRYEQIRRENEKRRKKYAEQEELRRRFEKQEQEEEEKRRQTRKKRVLHRKRRIKYGTFGWKRWWRVSVSAMALVGVLLAVRSIGSYVEANKVVETTPEIEVDSFIEDGLKQSIQEREQELIQNSIEQESKEVILNRQTNLIMPEWIEQDFLDVNPYSRPGELLEQVNGIVIHYVGNPNTTALQNRNYFQSLANEESNPNGTQASSHFVVGLEGEIIQCIPISEISYCSNERNVDTIAIEVCHPEADGKFTDATYQSVLKLTAWLCEQLDLTQEDVIRHYDVTGKKCPLYFVEHPDAWTQFLQDVKNYMEENPNL